MFQRNNLLGNIRWRSTSQRGRRAAIIGSNYFVQENRSSYEPESKSFFVVQFAEEHVYFSLFPWRL